MTKNTIKVFARLKQENLNELPAYEIRRTSTKEVITFHKLNVNGVFNTKPSSYSFRFEKIFDGRTSQEGLFNTLAKPIIQSSLEGYNGTILAYGQTGSGKTYTMTGSSEYFEERGIIPRSIEEIFKHTKQNISVYTIYISYLEIYNEIGYDLLDSRRQISSVEDIDELAEKGSLSTHNLTHQKVSSEEEAMMLLLVGDSNRITVETGRNLFSSRSHCIFTITISSRNAINGKIRRSKLNLIDLAGSERVSKSNLSGATLREAKHINLSLHYLQHVIFALNKRRRYVPFRNSTLTYLLKDSLSGQSVTVLLANLDVKTANFEESIATCKFSQKVGNVIIETKLNKEIEPQEDITRMKQLIAQLQVELSSTSRFRQNGALSKEEREKYKILINNYLLNPKEELTLDCMDMRAIRYCFKLLKQVAKEYEADKLNLETKDKENRDALRQYSQIVEEQEKEITRLKSTGSTSLATHTTTWPSRFEENSTSEKSTNELEFYNESIEKVYREAASLVAVIEQCQRNILNAKSNCEKLSEERVLYRRSLSKLQQLKNKSDTLKIGLKRETEKVINGFDRWHEHIEWNHFLVETQTSILSSGRSSSQNTSVEGSNKENCTSMDATNFPKHKCREVFKVKDINVLPMGPAAAEMSYSTRCSTPRYVYNPNFSVTDDELANTSENVHWNTPEKENSVSKTVLNSNDPPEFAEFIRTIALTGDIAVDEEIVRFYRTKFFFTTNS
ncbi:hypothetical protein PPYR_07423 [Photinus pyralis]|uniref:Kinesin-like protein n=1 Tax=Photinus pyralis TaxID=7054 RepID=A0A5N4AQK2_PHOPY|nr:kinesin-like protein KIF6 [Photinus pyralis]KAB0799543.1 hypothetical protein PPYR_07423 [Photinus pyralis]